MEEPAERSAESLGDDRVLVEFVVSVTTSEMDDAGTDANIYIVINGDRYLLDHGDYNDLERGDADHYHFAFARPITLRDLKNAKVSLCNDGTGNSSGWHCARATLFVQPRGPAYTYFYRDWPNIGWLAEDEPGGLNHVLQ